MIIRRRHTANYTTIGNVLFNDERLDADEIGVLAWLLSRPNDWEIRRPALMKRLHIGRDSLRRILRKLIQFGWIVARVTRLSNGTVHILYEVRDEPGPELTADQAKAALLLVSSDAGPGESADNDGPEDGTEADQEGVGIQPDADPGGGQSYSGQPQAANRLRQGVSGHIEELLKTDSVRTESPKGVRVFSEVRSGWPTKHILSTVTSQAAFESLTDQDKGACYDGMKPYLAECSATGRKVCDLRTYIVERRWERFQVKLTNSQTKHTYPGTPQAFRWREYLERAEPQTLKIFDLMMSRNGWTAPSEWPPAMPPKPETTGPPQPQELSEEDIRDFK